VIYPAQVQGDLAAAEVASGVRYFNESRSVEVIIVGAGRVGRRFGGVQ